MKETGNEMSPNGVFLQNLTSYRLEPHEIPFEYIPFGVYRSQPYRLCLVRYAVSPDTKKGTVRMRENWGFSLF